MADKAEFKNSVGHNDIEEKLQTVKNLFCKMSAMTSPLEQYSLLSDAIELLIKVGDSNFLSKTLKTRYIGLAIEAFQHLWAIGAQNKLLIQVLVAARKFATMFGDDRSAAICDFQLGTLYLALNETQESEKAHLRAISVVHDIGDSEITDTAALFSITYHTLRGEPQKVLDAYHDIRNSLQKSPVNPFLLTFVLPSVALSAAFTGDFKLGIQLLISGRHTAQSMGAKAADLGLQAQLGWLLAVSGNLGEARTHIMATIEASERSHSPQSRFWSIRSMAYMLYLEGKMQDACEKMSRTNAEFMSTGSFSNYYCVPWFLEMLQDFHYQNLDPICGYEYKKEIIRIKNGHNMHLKGVAYRLMALDARREGSPLSRQIELLKSSEELLFKTGGRIELGKTWLAIARTYIERGNTNLVSRLVSDAWQIYANSAPNLFPEDLNYLIQPAMHLPVEREFWMGHKSLMEALDQLQLPASQKELNRQILLLICNFFNAEQGFIFYHDITTDNLVQESAFNFSCLGNESSDLKWIQKTAIRSVSQNKSTLLKSQKVENAINCVLCIPFHESENKFILCLCTSYRRLIQRYSEPELLKLSDHISGMLCFIVNKLLRLEKAHSESLGQLSMSKEPADKTILFVGDKMRKLLDDATSAAKIDVPMLIMGETGVGKEMIAKYIHEQSPRKNMPFVTIDLGCITESLMESELFGHERGAFTGADKQRIGCIELANKGTLFIDEIGEIPLSMQVKLLRVVQEKTFRRIGSMRTRFSDFRLIAATNRNLKQDVQNQRFRQDLFHRLNVVPMIPPPLRERKEDIMHLANHFLEFFSHKHRRAIPFLESAHEHCLKQYSWPGNVRELKNLMERVVVMQDVSLIQKTLEGYIQPVMQTPDRAAGEDEYYNNKDNLPTLDQIQVDYIKYVLRRTNGRIAGKKGAAKILGMKRPTLYNRMNKLGISRSQLRGWASRSNAGTLISIAE